LIVVTGASRGIGKAVAERLLSTGVDVLGVARDVTDVRFPSLTCDVSSHEQVTAIARHLKKERKTVSGLINAAGIASMNLAVTTPPELVRKIIGTNLLGTIYCCQSLAPLMMRHKRGSIINFSTIAVALGLKGESAYVASKAGVEGFSRSFAREMADFDISVNCISPGPIETSLLKGVTQAQIDDIVSRQIYRRQFNPEAVCDLVEMLLDKRSESITGQVLNVGGV
jgi:3-oxoacyl-[acyl-carrier protein] reductase